MRNKSKKIELVFSLIAFLIIFALMILNQQENLAISTRETVNVFINSFFVPGAVLFGTGALSWTGKHGVFDGLVYSFTNFAKHLFIPTRTKSKYESFYEYRVKKEEKHSGWLIYPFLIGLCGIVISLILTLVYYLV